VCGKHWLDLVEGVLALRNEIVVVAKLSLSGLLSSFGTYGDEIHHRVQRSVDDRLCMIKRELSA
jgi:hypothetical protein